MSTNIICSVFLLVILLGCFAAGEDRHNSWDGNSRVYDYIVVGVGQAGSVIAGRLAAVKKSNNRGFKYEVLGIEAGPTTHRSLNGTDFVAADYIVSNGTVKVAKTPFTRFDVPAFTDSISAAPTAYPLPNVWLNGALGTVANGILLGGSGAHNGMLWSRHTRDSINEWGVNGWNYTQVLPYYIKSEDVSESTQSNYLNYHGVTGPIKISDTLTRLFPIAPTLLESCTNLGYPLNPDFNGESRYGCGQQVWSIGKGVRSSAASAHLPQAMTQGNLKLELEAFATKILIKQDRPQGPPKAYGVEYIQGGQIKKAYARKEVIVSLSAVFTPRLLLLSGIGPAADLEKLGIDVWVNNPNVGKNLLTNQAVGGIWNYSKANWHPHVNGASVEYAINKTGTFATTGRFAALYFCSNGDTATCTDPDVLVQFLVGRAVIRGGVAVSSQKSIAFQVFNCKPKSTGTVSLISADPLALVNVTYNLISQQVDVDTIVKGYKEIRRLFAQPPLSDTVEAELLPGPAVSSDEQLAAYVRSGVGSAAHWVGTARFGNAGDERRVTDPQMRVVGIIGLRIGDTSVLPNVNSHLQASAVMVGERCADFILN